MQKPQNKPPSARFRGYPVSNSPLAPASPQTFTLLPMEEYIKIAKANRPEFKALLAGQEARSALRDAKRAQSYPIVLRGVMGSIGWTPVRDRQDSVFAYDPFNAMTGGVGLGLKFDLEFARHSAEAHEQDAELMKLKATESWAAPGIELQVRKAFWELEQANDGLKIASDRKTLAKKWFVSNAMGWSIGITPAKDLWNLWRATGF